MDRHTHDRSGIDRQSADAELLKAVAAGDHRAFERLYRAHHASVLGFCMRVTGQIDKADDAVAETFSVVWRRAGSFEGRAQVSTWIFGIAYRIATRARQRSQLAAKRDVELDTNMPMEPSERAQINVVLERAQLERAIAKLTPEHRAVIELAYFHDLGVDEVSEIVSAPKGTVKTRLMHARRQLRRLMCGDEAGERA